MLWDVERSTQPWALVRPGDVYEDAARMAAAAFHRVRLAMSEQCVRRLALITDLVNIAATHPDMSPHMQQFRKIQDAFAAAPAALAAGLLACKCEAARLAAAAHCVRLDKGDPPIDWFLEVHCQAAPFRAFVAGATGHALRYKGPGRDSECNPLGPRADTVRRRASDRDRYSPEAAWAQSLAQDQRDDGLRPPFSYGMLGSASQFPPSFVPAWCWGCGFLLDHFPSECPRRFAEGFGVAPP